MQISTLVFCTLVSLWSSARLYASSVRDSSDVRPKKVNCEERKKRKRRWTHGTSIESTESSGATNRPDADIIAGINGDVNSPRISSANSATGNGSKLRQRPGPAMQPVNGRTGRLIRQFERQLEFRVRPRAASKYARDLFLFVLNLVISAAPNWCRQSPFQL